ncbi:MFS transporter [Caproiciproducens galactitolivorans]|uniref:Multidrug resistance protein 3 n=1 Tax=Caproiciproducens galactitolivorans TaxID=642589 RepID=A0A4Z0YET7_9FIRM|nr:MDR family MFS transporter [Caproiciproducens galactitolivorans]QEY35699.1 MFS transporter [Caproiciproducens galactitolivorans]TGJ77430.1 multidrug resistance protein 3 [Caproiciproducens galactitolivorans]
MNTKKRSLMIALMTAMFLGAVEGTVVTTAIPTIVKDLQGFQMISFVFSVYLLASAITTPIYGKLSDLYGRKNTLSIGIFIFITGSFLCGLSQNMYMLIGFRVLQGLGAGSIFTVTYTIVGDVFTLEERPKVQGMLGTVWGIASLAGPFLGGIIIETLTWHWIFFINIPFGILSVILLQRNIKESFEKKKQPFDFAGIITLSAAMLIFLNMFLSMNTGNTNQKPYFIASITLTLFLLLLFYKIEKKAKEPIFPFDIFTKESTLANIICFLASTIMIGMDCYMPIYLQNVLGLSAKISGLSMAPMSISWLIASVVLGRCMVRRGGKAANLISNGILLVSTLCLPTLGTKSPLILVLLYVFIMGFGLGGTFTILTIMIQQSVEYNKRGAATAANSLVKTLGETIGISIFGSVFNLFLTKFFVERGIHGVNPGNLYKSSTTHPAVTGELTKEALNSSLHILLILFLIISILCMILSVCIPDKNKASD